MTTLHFKRWFRPLLAVALGAIAGALGRYYLGLWCMHHFGSTFPYGTLLINGTGSFAMGLLTAFFVYSSSQVHPDLRLMLTTGGLGSYTTFSTYALDTTGLLTRGQVAIALLYWAGSLVLGLLGLQLGLVLVERRKQS
ncbi:MAG TPA: fluoride efflux transporter CrcB [Leptolyngbyaceae cyanobacterium M33_DOE_097]|uniref:Fluoride-specific ion channel FluC n=1 Tax=Oscillatoriales cyanobacterium SpSt-418 TaxID=2282169 RepID=A0A7C3KGC0_9CYAN|nr:fluoride efflux transporter CrcB [Leptolyngbyaceae cyanobacterium M33_DOE_097]